MTIRRGVILVENGEFFREKKYQPFSQTETVLSCRTVAWRPFEQREGMLSVHTKHAIAHRLRKGRISIKKEMRPSAC